MKSIGAMLKQLFPMVGTKDLTPWESQFITSQRGLTKGGYHTENLTGKQCDIIQKIYGKHFSDADETPRVGEGEKPF